MEDPDAKAAFPAAPSHWSEFALGADRPSRLVLRDIRRAAGRRRRKRRLQLLALLTLLLVGGTAGYFHLPGRGGATQARGTTNLSPSFHFATQGTAMLQVRGSAGDSVASALLADDPVHHTAAMIMIPNRVMTGTEPGRQTMFGQALQGSGGPVDSRRALSDLLGVRIDDSWMLDQTAFSRLVDRIGGITTDIDVDIVAQRGGKSAVVVPKGPHRKLDGAGAAAALSYRPAGKDELSSMARVQAVLRAVVAQLPAGGTKVADLAGALGSGSDVTDVLTVPRIVDGLRFEQAAGRATFSTLPVLAIGTGAGLTYRLEPVATTHLVGQVLAGSARIGRPELGNRVLAINGAGIPGFGSSVRDRITRAGFTLIDARKEATKRTQTVIIIFDTTSQSTVRASQLASALGLPQAPVRVAERMQNIADLIVAVGSDFKP